VKKITQIISPYFYFNLYVDLKLKIFGLRLYHQKLQGFNIEYWDSKSEKPSLILIQAFAAESKFSWFKQVRILSKTHRLIIPNLIYFGNSSMESKSHHLADQVNALQELINHLNLANFSICGASYGGVIAAELALQNQAKTKKLVLTNTPFKYNLESDIQVVLDDLKIANKPLLLAPSNHKALYLLFRLSYFKNPHVPTFIFRGIFKNLYLKNKADKQKLIATATEDLTALKTKEYPFKLPILLLWGEHDRLAPVRIAEELKVYFGAGAELIKISKTAHMPNFEKPIKYGKLLRDFLVKEK